MRLYKMLAARRIVARAASVRGLATQAAQTSAAAVDPEHKAWLDTVSKYPVKIPKFEWTLEWILPTPVPQHQFEQSPVVVEVKDRNADPDALIYKGANVVGGYPHFETGKPVSREEHLKLVATNGTGFDGGYQH